MESLWEKLGAIIAAIITAISGLYLHDRKATHDRLTKIESDVMQSKTDIKVVEVKFNDLKEDTEEIKQTQKMILDLLTKKRR